MAKGSRTCGAGKERREGSENALPALKSHDNSSVAGNSGTADSEAIPGSLETHSYCPDLARLADDGGRA